MRAPPRRRSIRLRLTLTYALLGLLLVSSSTAAVVLLEQRDSHRLLARSARSAATELATATAQDTGNETDDGATSTLQRYLADRAAANELLLVVRPGAAPLANRRAALDLAPIAARGGSGVSDVEVGGRDVTTARLRTATGAMVVAAVPRELEERRVANLVVVLLGVGAAALLFTVALAWLAARSALEPLRRMADRAARVGAGDLDVQVGGDDRTRDEIGEVGRAIDAMLGRLAAAFAAQRRFVQDASHELRTPLTIARGQLEVLALDEAPDPVEVRAVIGVVIAELERMGELVSGLLGLARLDERGLERRDRVDLVAVAESACARARGLGDREITVRATGRVIVQGDAGLLEQTVLNLLTNAVRHTRPGGRIDVELRAGAGAAVLDVADDGDGIDPALLPTLFDRFTRADAARHRDTGGAGLGLAICRAIVDAHEGAISAGTSTLGGALISIRLPAPGA